MTTDVLYRIIFGLGSNLDNRELNINLAIKKLQQNLELKNVKTSTFITSKALLKENAPSDWDLDFINAAMSGDVDLQKFPAQKILQIAQAIEKEIGRNNAAEGLKMWAPREIDIDILAIGNLKIDLGAKLQIPHPEIQNRDFVKTPVAEIEPYWLQELQKKL